MAVFSLILPLAALLGLLIGLSLVGGKRTRLERVAGTAVLLLVIPFLAFLGWSVVEDRATEWNPVIATDAEILGEWTDGGSTHLTLEPGRTATWVTGKESLRGEWSRDDWNLTLHLRPPEQTREARLYRYRGALRLLLNPGSDPDAWSPRNGLERE